MTARRLLVSAVTLVLAGIVAFGFVTGEPSESDRASSLGNRIRCPVCQGESIAESPSETAVAMMEIVEERVAAGQTNGQIIGYFQDRYGDFIVLDPPFRGRTLVLWLLPVAALGAGIVLILRRVQRAEPDTPAATADADVA